jgi:queuine tRNA-ribosyltransferase
MPAGTLAVTGFAHRILATDGAARTGVLATAHGDVATPAFMPVGTAGTVKAMTADAVRATGADIVLGNTYHLMLRPGAERVARLGGLHRFMDWPGPILTDSGGFQVMSLAKLRKLDADGVTFQSHLDGSTYRLTPARSIEIQHLLDATITMALDECTSFPATTDEARASMQLSMRWARQSREAFAVRPGYALFGIVQGSVYSDLRAESAHALTAIGFDGYAIGGLAIGEGQATTFAMLDATLPRHRRRSARHRHVRLRDTHARGTYCTCLHVRGRVQHTQRAVRRRCRTARSSVCLPSLHTPQPGLSQPSVQGRGNARTDAAHMA